MPSSTGEPRRRNVANRIRRPVRLRDVGSDPDYRYSLANERTFLAWIRTSLALLAGGIAVIQLATDFGPRQIRIVVGVTLIVIGGAIAGLAHYHWTITERAMRLEKPLPRNRLAVILGYGVAVVAVVVLVALAVTG